MSKINKYCNIYDKDGNLIRHVGEDGVLHNYTIEELQELVDKLSNDRDEDGNIKDPLGLNNASGMLFRMYQEEPGQVHLRAMFEEFKKRSEESKNDTDVTTEDQVKEALEEVKEEVEKQYNIDTLDDEYVEFKEIEDNDGEGSTTSSSTGDNSSVE